MKWKLISILLVVAVGVIVLNKKQQYSDGTAGGSKKKTQRFLASTPNSSESLVLQPKEALKANPSYDDFFQDLRDGFASYQRCQEEGNCSFEEGDSRSGDFQASKLLLQKLEGMNLQVNQNGWHSRNLSQLARELLTIDDGAIKEEALKLLLSQQPEPENVEAVADGIFKYHDSNLVEHAITEYEKHLYGDEANSVHATIRTCLLTGSLFVRESLSMNMGKFINSGSYDFYRELSKDPSIDSVVKRNLRSSLMEYQLNQSGG